MTAIDTAKALIFTGGTIPTSGASAGDLAAEVADREAAVSAIAANVSKSYLNRASAVNAGQSNLPVAYGMISTLEGQVLKIRAHNNSTNDPLFVSAPYWGVVFEINITFGPFTLGSVSGTNTITAQLPSGAVMASGSLLVWQPTGANTGNVTLNVDGQNRAVRKGDGSQLAAGDLSPNRYIISVFSSASHYVVGFLPSDLDQVALNALNKVTDITNVTPVGQRDLNAYSVAGQNLSINRNSEGGVITNLPPSISTTAPRANVWNTREGNLVIQNFHHRDSGRRWSRSWNGSSWGAWVEIEPNRILPSLIPQLLHTAYNGAVVGADQRDLRREIIAAASMFVSSADHANGPVESIATRGSWGLTLTKTGTSTPQMTADGLVMDGAGWVQNISASPIVKEPFSRYEAFASFTQTAAPLGSERVFLLSLDAATTLSCSVITAGPGFYRLRIDLPNSLTFIDGDFVYPLGDRARILVAVDYAAGEAQITQGGRINIVPFTPPASKNMQVSRVSLGESAAITLHEFLAIGRNR